MNNNYQPLMIESFWNEQWISNNLFITTINPNNHNNYSICLPPPNVTGSLHLGHVLQHTAMDTLIRYHKMNGYNVLWQIGTDHAGIATQIVVENKLKNDGKTKEDLGRDHFIHEVKKWKEISGGTIITQMKRLGLACDWDREAFTMDDNLSQIVKQVFIDMFHKGKIYKSKALVNWDPVLKSAISDLEVTTKDYNGNIWHIKYQLQNSKNYIEIATTRPETMFGDVAIAVHPQDDRYKNLIGENVIIPISNRVIPIIASDTIDQAFGSGCVKITPAHDFHDYELAVALNLDMINIFTPQAILNNNCPSEYIGLDYLTARNKLIVALTELGYIIDIKPHKISMPINERTGTVIQPMLTEQWFMKMDEMAVKALSRVLENDIEFIPTHHINTYKHWMSNVKDWCISRQLWWGHRIPAYYKVSTGELVVAKSIEEDCVLQQQVKEGILLQDESVLDTWFSSALWCFATLGWPKPTKEMQRFFPTSVLVTGFDIIFFWVARMIMMTEECTGKIPFHQVYITGLVYDIHGKKMSKSKGNVIDPMDIINGISFDDLIIKRTSNLMNPKQKDDIIKHTKKDYPAGFKSFGADSLRWYMLSVNTNGAEIRFDINQIEAARLLANKIWNAGKFVLMQLEKYNNLVDKDCFYYADYITINSDGHISTNTIDLINIDMINKINRLVKEVKHNLENYRFDWLTHNIYEIFWNEFCDWFVEMNKIHLNQDLHTIKKSINTLGWCFDSLIKILHPLIPFITEEIWQHIAMHLYTNKKTFLIENHFPSFELANNKISLLGLIYEADCFLIELKAIVGTIRQIRAQRSICPSVKVELLINHKESINLDQYFPYIQSLAKISIIETKDAILPNIVNSNITIDIVAQINTAEEIKKNQNKLEKSIKNAEKLRHKLADDKYLQKAPSSIIDKDKLLLAQEEATIIQLRNTIQSLADF
jgi:valyl-tRNA synthetase